MKGKFATILLVLAIPGLALTAGNKSSKYEKAPKPVADIGEAVSVTSSKPTEPAPNKTSGAPPILIGKTWNAYAPQSSFTNLISYDPISKLAAIVKRTDRTGAGSGFIVYQISDDAGVNWTPQIGPVNFTTADNVALNAGRHPNLLLSNPTQSADPLDVNVVFSYNDLTRNGGLFGEVAFGADNLTGDPSSLLSKGSDTADAFGYAGAVNLNNGDAYYSVVGVNTNPYDVLKVSNGGMTIGSRVSVVADLVGTAGGGTALDVGNDGTVYHVARDTWSDAPNGNDSTFAWRLNWSTDGGATWQGPEFVFPDIVPGFTSSNYEFDMIVDGNGRVHIAALLFNPNDTPSAFDGSVITLYDLVRTAPNSWVATSLGRVRVQVFRGSSLGDAAPPLQMLNEPEFAKTASGMDLALKWVDVTANAATPADSTSPEVYVRRLGVGGTAGWEPANKVTNTPNIYEKFTNLATYMSDTGQLFMYYIDYTGTATSGRDLEEHDIYFLPEARVPVGVADNRPAALPKTFALAQNFPNPFNPSTTIKFSLPQSANVKLAVFNQLGQQVSTLLNGNPMEAGTHEVRFASSHLPSGVYFYRLEAGSNVMMKKMVLMK